ncbi:MAG: tRNA (N(6)-L-threonylcarbamoyladenosine(37)-C(2))-methylthiotransferase MtaB [Roseburia sp.]|nr:tRNA (N(6)-L-threonylcarbamoyladenosine(37)-C(2))-methylthiotransferase MtaB [Roseburia sp.]
MKACVFTLGCKMNEVESESLMRGLEELGFEVTEELGYADLYLLNTCAVTAEAEKKSRQAVARMRKFNSDAPVVVCGCASQNNAEAFLQKEGVVLVTGAQGKDKILSLLSERGIFRSADETFCELPLPKRTKTRAYLRIQDGCNRFCSYCLIPYLRGRTRSRAAQSVLEEARAMNAKEIVLTGIDITSYRDGETDLSGLIKLLSEVPARIRLGSLEAGIVTKELLSAMKAAGNALPHFHLSLQSGSSKVLRAMNRHYTREVYLEKCALIYAHFPNAAITTDIIVGFPTETEEDFAQSLSVVKEAGFAKVHAFPYSRREGTAAAKMKEVPASVKKERMGRMLQAADAAEQAYLSRFLGSEQTVLYEEDGGYTENYIRVYADGAREGGLYRMKLIEIKNDGVSAEIIEEL